jgi:hypothetical protein
LPIRSANCSRPVLRLSLIYCLFGRFIDEFSRFIGKIYRYLSVGDFTIHIFNQMNFD